MPRDDAELLARASRGDDSAFATLYDRYQQDLYRFVCYLAGDPDTADDLFQETWFRVVRNMGKKDIGDFRKWMFAIASNLYRDELRKRKVRRFFIGGTIEDAGPGVFPSPAQTIPPAEEGFAVRQALAKAMQKLTVRQRTVFVLTHIEGYKIREVAEMLGKSQGTIKSTLHRAVDILRVSMREFRRQG